MVDSGYTTPTGRLVIKGAPANTVYRNLGTVANGYPGRLVVRETTDYDVKVSDGILPPLGWIGYEQQATQYQVTNISTINVVDTEVPVINGGGFTIYMPSGLTVGSYAAQGDPLLSWSAGKVISGTQEGGKYAVKIPFSKSTTEADTGIDLPAGSIVTDVLIDVVTNASGATIDVGLLSTESSGNADGFVDGASCATATKVRPGATVTTGSSEVYLSASTRGVLLVDTFTAGADSAGDVGTYVEKNHVCDGTTVSVTYTTSDHTVAGYIYLFVESPGIKPVGFSGTTVDASSATAGVFVETTI